MAEENQVPVVDDAKSLFESKTFWGNTIALVAVFAQAKFGFVIDPATQMQILALINIVLRTITNKPVNIV